MVKVVGCRVSGISLGATNLLHHWQQQDPTLWPSAPKRQQQSVPSAARPSAPIYHPQRQQQQTPWQPPLQASGAHHSTQGIMLGACL